MNNKEKVITPLRQIRKNNHFTYEMMAQRLGICKSYYWQLENGYRRLYYDLALKIAYQFNLKPDDLFYDHYK